MAQPESTIGLLQEQHTPIAADIAALESGFDLTAFTGWKVKRLLGTFCHGQSPVRIQPKQLNLIELYGLCPSYWCNIRAKSTGLTRAARQSSLELL